MPIRRRLTFVLALVALLTAPAFAQTSESKSSETPPAPTPPPAPAPASQASPNAQPATQGRVLTLEECVARALNKDFDLRIQNFSTESAKESLTIARATFDPALQVTATSSYSRQPSGTSYLDDAGNIVTGSRPTSSFDSTRVGVTQELPTGTVASVSGALNRSKSTPARSQPNPAYNSDVSLTVRQPLLRGAGSRVARSGVERAKLGVTIANLDFKSSVLAVVRNVEAAYYDLAFAREQLGVRRFSLDVANRLLEENRSRRQTGVATDLDVLQAEVQVANARRDTLLAEKTVHDREDRLLSLIEPFGFTEQLGDIRLPDDPVPTIDAERSYHLARENTPDYAAERTVLEQLKIDAAVARQNRLPGLDLTGSLGYNAKEDSYSNAASRVWTGKGYNWEIDATLSLPWGLRAERARYRQALNNVSREEVKLQQIEQGILVDVRSAVRTVQTSVESARISALATELSQRQFDLEKARYDAGLSTFRRVQEAQADWDTARVNELQAKVALRNALAELYRIEGTSLQRYNIKLQTEGNR